MKLGFTVTPSQSNFLLARWSGTPSAGEIHHALVEQSIFVRYFDMRMLSDCLRISVGTDAEVDRLIEAITEIVA